VKPGVEVADVDADVVSGNVGCIMSVMSHRSVIG